MRHRATVPQEVRFTFRGLGPFPAECDFGTPAMRLHEVVDGCLPEPPDAPSTLDWRVASVDEVED